MEETIGISRRSWRVQHERDLEAWNENLRQRKPSQEQNGSGGDDPSTFPRGDTPQWLNEPTPSYIGIQPASYILKRLERKEYVEMWYFTAQGCRDAAFIDLTVPNDTFGIVNTEKGLMLQMVGVSSVSTEVTRDENLSWEQLSEGKGRLLDYMSSCGWSGYEVRELAKFFLNLDLHPIRSQVYGTQTVLRYQDRVRHDWVSRLKSGNSFAIGTINNELMGEYQRQIGMEIQAKNNVGLFLTSSKV